MEALKQSMDQFQQNLVQLTGAINRQIEQINVIEARLTNLEHRNVRETVPSSNLVAPTTEADLISISKLPDSVRDLQVFEGNPIQYVSWIHGVESILKDYEIIRNKPMYRAILKHIRQKIRGEADNALISYNIFDEEWSEIKKCLSLHYADKRDIQSLENQLVKMRQGKDSVNQFYGKVNRQLSLIINKIKTDDYSEDGKNVLVVNYRLRALDVFIRGLPQNLSHLVKVQKPSNLPEAYAACVELQNMDFRKALSSEDTNYSIQGRNVRSNYQNQNTGGRQFNQGLNIQHAQSSPLNAPPPRPMAPKPPVPMDVDQSIRTMKIDYMNRPNTTVRPSNMSSNIPRKTQRVFNIETVNSLGEQEEDEQCQEQEADEEYFQQLEEELTEVNFMTGAYQGFPT